MRSPSRTVVAVATVCAALAALAAAVAQAVTPPAGTPNMAAMAVQRGDLGGATGAFVGGYAKPQTGFVAAYTRTFGVAEARSGGSPFEVETELELAAKASTALRVVREEKVLYSSKEGRALLGAVIVGRAPKKDHVTLKSLVFSAPTTLHVGSDSFIESLSLQVKGFKEILRFATLDVSRVAVSLIFVGVGTLVPESTVTELSGAVAAHIRRVLAKSSGASGSTLPVGIIGPSGPSGASGASGTTGATGAT
jgi:opacity protein-like surface antigen